MQLNNWIHFDSIDSTQKEAWRLYENDGLDGTLIMADIQTDGVGTHGRKWYTEEKNNIAFSVLLKPNCDIEKLDGLTRKIAEIIVSIFCEKYNIELDIKEPNDIMKNGKKIGGILTETKIEGNKVKALVVGIGINTSQVEFAKDIKDIASSIKREFDVDVDANEFVREFCNQFEKEISERRKK